MSPPNGGDLAREQAILVLIGPGGPRWVLEGAFAAFDAGTGQPYAAHVCRRQPLRLQCAAAPFTLSLRLRMLHYVSWMVNPTLTAT